MTRSKTIIVAVATVISLAIFSALLWPAVMRAVILLACALLFVPFSVICADELGGGRAWKATAGGTQPRSAVLSVLPGRNAGGNARTAERSDSSIAPAALPVAGAHNLK